MRINSIDNLFLDKIREIRLNKDFIILQKNSVSVINDEKTVSKELSRIETAINNLTIALHENVESTAAKYIISQIEQLDSERNVYLKQRREIAHYNRQKKTEAETKENIYAEICDLLDNFDDLSYTDKNEAVKRIVSKCVLDGSSLNIVF